MKQQLTWVVSTVLAVVITTTPNANAEPITTPRYAALGDSVAAGFGLSAGSETSKKDQLCGRSDQAYPHHVASYYGYNLNHIACSGAKFDEGLYGPQTINGVKLPEQIERVFRHSTPLLMSITIGANDMRWRYFVTKCYLSRCGTTADTLLFEALLLDMRYEQWRMRTEVEYRSEQNGTGEPLTVLTGYYNPFGPKNCLATRGITDKEKEWITSRLQLIHHELRRAAGLEDWLTYAPVDSAFSGHRLCSADPWITNPGSDGQLHANNSGQITYANALIASLS